MIIFDIFRIFKLRFLSDSKKLSKEKAISVPKTPPTFVLLKSISSFLKLIFNALPIFVPTMN